MIRLSARPIKNGSGCTYTICVSGRVRLITGDPNHVGSHLALLGVVSPEHLVAEARQRKLRASINRFRLGR